MNEHVEISRVFSHSCKCEHILHPDLPLAFITLYFVTVLAHKTRVMVGLYHNSPRCFPTVGCTGRFQSVTTEAVWCQILHSAPLCRCRMHPTPGPAPRGGGPTPGVCDVDLGSHKEHFLSGQAWTGLRMPGASDAQILGGG